MCEMIFFFLFFFLSVIIWPLNSYKYPLECYTCTSGEMLLLLLWLTIISKYFSVFSLLLLLFILVVSFFKVLHCTEPNDQGFAQTITKRLICLHLF